MMNIQSEIERKLVAALNPEYLAVDNESHMHNVPPNSETHFKVVVVSKTFVDKGKVFCHQLIYGVLKLEMAGPIHALAIHTYTPKQWQQANAIVPDSPNCMGGGTER
jgi:BolA protein